MAERSDHLVQTVPGQFDGDVAFRQQPVDTNLVSSGEGRTAGSPQTLTSESSIVDSIFFSFSHAARRRNKDRGDSQQPLPYFLSISSLKCETRMLSTAAPPTPKIDLAETI